MVHQRSFEKRVERKLQRKAKRHRREVQRFCLLQFSQRDYLNGEICHTLHTEPIVYEQIKLILGADFEEPVTANLEYGQVLNRYSNSELYRTIITAGRYKHE